MILLRVVGRRPHVEMYFNFEEVLGIFYCLPLLVRTGAVFLDQHCGPQKHPMHPKSRLELKIKCIKVLIIGIVKSEQFQDVL